MTSVVFTASLLLSCCADSSGNGSATMSAINAPGTATPTGSPEYQALAKEACELINGSRCTFELDTATRLKNLNHGALTHSKSHSQGRNARFTAPWILASELQTNTTYADKINPANRGEDNRTVFSQIDLRSVTRAKAIDPSGDRALNKFEDSSTARAVVSTPYYAVVTEGPGFSGTLVVGTVLRLPAREPDVAYFDNKAKALRLAVVLNRLAVLAKVG